jgi:hypothetical protein
MKPRVQTPIPGVKNKNKNKQTNKRNTVVNGLGKVPWDKVVNETHKNPCPHRPYILEWLRKKTRKKIRKYTLC